MKLQTKIWEMKLDTTRKTFGENCGNCGKEEMI